MENLKDSSYLKSIETACQVCKGTLWNDNQTIREKAVKERFGTIPNSCVSPSTGKILCPYSKKTCSASFSKFNPIRVNL